jgi:hypothetical protein
MLHPGALEKNWTLNKCKKVWSLVGCENVWTITNSEHQNVFLAKNLSGIYL